MLANDLTARLILNHMLRVNDFDFILQTWLRSSPHVLEAALLEPSVLEQGKLIHKLLLSPVGQRITGRQWRDLILRLAREWPATPLLQLIKDYRVMERLSSHISSREEIIALIETLQKESDEVTIGRYYEVPARREGAPYSPRTRGIYILYSYVLILYSHVNMNSQGTRSAPIQSVFRLG